MYAWIRPPWIRPPWIRPPWNRPAWIRPPCNRPAWIRQPWIHPPEKLHFAKEEKGIETVALVRALNKGRLDSLGADLQIEKEQGRVAGRRLQCPSSAGAGHSATEDCY